MSLGEMKKNELLEFFKEAVRAEVRQDSPRMQKAMDNATSKGLSMADLEWVAALKAPEFKKVFGENALPIDLVERMEDHDAMLKGFQYSPRFEGFYPKAK